MYPGVRPLYTEILVFTYDKNRAAIKLNIPKKYPSRQLKNALHQTFLRNTSGSYYIGGERGYFYRYPSLVAIYAKISALLMRKSELRWSKIYKAAHGESQS